jgi:DNA primase
VVELSENLKLRLDQAPGENPQDRPGRPADSASPADAGPVDEAESQMRRALGLLGESPRHRPEHERMEQPSRSMADRFNGGLHRRRFVQDGDVPVTVLRREPGYEQPAHRGAPATAAPTSSRLQRTEATLATETAARERAERSLAETQNIVRDLQTKIGHAELAKTEAVEALRRERDSLIQLRAETDAWQQRLQEAHEQAQTAERAAHTCEEELIDERHARKLAEKALRLAESARDSAEQLVRTLSEESAGPRFAEPVRRGRPPQAEPEVVEAATRSRRSTVAITPEPQAEPEPVKWWLNTKPAGKRR